MKQILPDQTLLHMRALWKSRRMIRAVTVIRKWSRQRKGRSRPVFFADAENQGRVAVPVSAESRGLRVQEGNPVHLGVPVDAETRGLRVREGNPVRLGVLVNAESRGLRVQEGNPVRLGVPANAVRRDRRE